jgi:hypothetical protein
MSANVKEDGERFTAVTPVPVNCIVCGELAAESVTVRVPVAGPDAVGAKATETVQMVLAARVFGDKGQVVVVVVNWLLTEMLLMVTGAVK